MKTKTITEWARESFYRATRKGFHGDNNPPVSDYHMDPIRIASRLMLITSELSEALEECARGRMELWHSVDADGRQKPEGFGVELADALIRLLDLAHATGIDIEALVEHKSEYNEGRQLMHGGKRL